MHSLRVQAGEKLYTLAAGDPIRSSFDQLHKVSVGLTGFAMLAAAVLMAAGAGLGATFGAARLLR